MEKQLILASQSPRRKELLEKCGVPFLIDVADVDETIDASKDLSSEIQRLAESKARTVFQRHPEAVVIGCDTIVTYDQTILGKPKDEADAKRMLTLLQGNTHEVITGLCILSKEKTIQEVSISKVTVASMSPEEIDAYIATKEPMDKAGAYAIQGIGSRYITHIAGDYYSIMGLPVHLVYEALKSLSIKG